MLVCLGDDDSDESNDSGDNRSPDLSVFHYGVIVEFV